MQPSTPPTQFLAGAWLSFSTGLLAFTYAIINTIDSSKRVPGYHKTVDFNKQFGTSSPFHWLVLSTLTSSRHASCHQHQLLPLDEAEFAPNDLLDFLVQWYMFVRYRSGAAAIARWSFVRLLLLYDLDMLVSTGSSCPAWLFYREPTVNKRAHTKFI
jgi:hypothetical protein